MNESGFESSFGRGRFVFPCVFQMPFHAQWISQSIEQILLSKVGIPSSEALTPVVERVPLQCGTAEESPFVLQ